MISKKIQNTGLVSHLFFRSLWMIFGVVVCINLASTLYAGYLYIKATSEDATQALATSLSYRIETIYKLLEGMSNQPLIQDTSASAMERALSMKTYADAFDFWMIGVVDPDGTISSTLRPRISKVERDYIPRILSTGQRELSDPFSAGATGDMCFSQFMPVKKNGKVVSIAFVTIPLSRMNKLPAFQSTTDNGYYLLVDSQHSIIAHPDSNKMLLKLGSLVRDEIFLLGNNKQQFLDNLTNRHGGSFLGIFEHRLTYTTYARVADSPWMLIHRVPVFRTILPMLLSFFAQTLLYGLFVVFLLRFGRRYFASVDNVFHRIAALNKNINKAEEFSVEEADELLNLSHRSLFDSLTGLPTRHLFHQSAMELIKETPEQLYGVFFFGMDKLKPINDNLGQDVGDKALQEFANYLADFAKQQQGLACRYSGDRFVLLIPLKNIAEILDIAQELVKTLRGSVEVDGKRYAYSTSIGICPYPFEALSFDRVLHAAKQSLQRAKSWGGSTFSVHKPGQEE